MKGDSEDWTNCWCGHLNPCPHINEPGHEHRVSNTTLEGIFHDAVVKMKGVTLDYTDARAIAEELLRLRAQRDAMLHLLEMRSPLVATNAKNYYVHSANIIVALNLIPGQSLDFEGRWVLEVCEVPPHGDWCTPHSKPAGHKQRVREIKH